MRRENGKDLEVLTFGLEGEVFAVEAESVREILDLVSVTDVPNSRPFVSGLINVRGKIVPLADLHIRFGMAPFNQSVDTRVVVIEVPLAGEPTTVGIIADKVFEVTNLIDASIEEAPDIGLKWRREFISGIGKRAEDFVIVLDMERIFAMGDTETVAQAEAAAKNHS
ncbi:chemotaxis protein CheW [Telmatospirillum siberiense]|uniref:Chemotaxis protein CheW n=1 Tax=Telmatospirillum siberiense TaxID=382514 RepID=A0A2N3PLV8_9PROT|nr:chemotaxis protein CheW [Telmatospirillum siberiense]PKU21382.1 chemotaxis protein CheW [Telmatospirillum siberiense]